MSENKGYGDWIGAIIITAFGWVIHSIVSKITPSFFKSKKKGSDIGQYSSFIKGDLSESKENISELFEEMCVKNPLAYKDDPRVKDVVRDYSDLIKGRILDIDGIHAPSLKIDGVENPDYYRYLRNQRRALKKAGKDITWAKDEMTRMTDKKNADAITLDFAEELLTRGFPEELLDNALTYSRIETHSPEDWNKLIMAVKDQVNDDLDVQYVGEFLDAVEDSRYYDEDIVDKYATLRLEDAPERISLEYAKGVISEEQAKRAAIYMVRGYSEEESLVLVLKETKDQIDSAELKNKYREMI